MLKNRTDAESTGRRNHKTQLLIGAVAIISTLAIFGGTASAATKTLVKYDASMHGNFSNTVKGTGSVWKYRFTQPGTPSSVAWGAQVQVKSLPQGNYTFAINVGTDIDPQGNPHKFTYYPVCTFYADGSSNTAGCGAAAPLPKNVDLSHSQVIVNTTVTEYAYGNLVRTK